MEIRPYRGTDEAGLLAVWQAAMTHDTLSADQFRTQVLLDPNFLRSICRWRSRMGGWWASCWA
jgi:hypothetical protein